MIAAFICIGMATGIRILFEDIPNVGIGTGYLVIALSIAAIALVLGEKKEDHEKALQIDNSLFKTDSIFNISAIAITLILVAIYSTLG